MELELELTGSIHIDWSEGTVSDGAADGTSEGELGVELEAAGRGSGRGGLARHDEDCVKKNKIYLKHRRKKDGRILFQQKEWGWDEEG